MLRLDLGRTVLLLAVIFTMAGLAVAAPLLLHRAAQERRGMEERALALAHSTAAAAEREVSAAFARLEALSESPALRAGDLHAFDAQLAATPTPEGTWFVLSDQAGQLLNTLLSPDGLPPQIQDYGEGLGTVREIMERNRPTVSGVVWAPVGRTHVTAVVIPVTLGPDRHRALLGTIIPTQRLLGLIREQAIPPRWRAALLDRFSKVIARIEPEATLRGAEPPEIWSPPIGGGPRAGLFTAEKSPAGPVLVAFVRPEPLEWTAVVEVPLALLQASWREALRWLLLSAAALSALGLAGAWWLRGRIDRSLGALRWAADTADKGQRAAEARFRHYWEHTPEGLYMVRVTPAGDFVFEGLNPAHEQATGLSNTATVGRTPEECLPAEAAATVRQHCRHCAELGAPIRYTETLELPGGRRDWESNLAPMRDPETGRVVMLFGTRRDVTDRRRAEEAVRLNEERLRLALSAAGAGTWDWDLATGTMYLSPEMHTLLGLASAAAGQKDLRAAWLDLIHPEDRPRVEDRLHAAVTGEGPFEAEYRFFQGGPGGELRWMASRGRVVQQGGEDGCPRRRMLGVAVDVTERRRAELAARDSLALLQSSLDALTAHVAILDATGRIVVVNAAWRRSAEARGAGDTAGPGADYLAVCDVARGVSPEADRVGDGLRAVAYGKTPEFRREYACTEPATQEQHWYQLRVTRFGEGTGLRLVVAHEDITEVRRSAEALKAMTGRLLTLQDEERRRIARELHDTTVQDLAMAIVGLDLAAAGCGVEACAASLAEARGQLERAVRDVRTLSYLLHPPLLDECGLAVALTAYVEGFAKRSGLACLLDLDDAPPAVVPPHLGVALFRVAQETIANVHRHSGGRTMRVGLRVMVGKMVELRIEDDGKGMRRSGALHGGWNVADAPQLMGVGIPGMRARVRQLGGVLRIESGPGGTAVVATVPLPAGGGGAEVPAA